MTDEIRRDSVLGSSWAREDPWPRAEQVALFLDFENLVLGATGSLPGRAEPVPAKALTWLCRAYGNASIRRAYADWADARFGRYQEALERNGVDQLQLSRGPSRKNAADIRMAVDAMETLITHPAVGAFVLVTGDSDFSPLVSRLREFGKHVIGVGAEAAVSARLVSVCSEYKLWRSIVARVEPDAQPGTQPGFRLLDAERLLVTAMEQASTLTPTASQVKARMLALDSSFDEANYGCRGFRDFLSRLGHRVRTAGRSGSDITLALIDQPPGGVTDPGP
ncbi:MAG TPA: NYN domain-containing protein [Pseudonocardiaceae bacterium]|nr:NYN domain-containing protein [Pseudonocardiaceae bacterium]